MNRLKSDSIKEVQHIVKQVLAFVQWRQRQLAFDKTDLLKQRLGSFNDVVLVALSIDLKEYAAFLGQEGLKKGVQGANFDAFCCPILRFRRTANVRVKHWQKGARLTIPCNIDFSFAIFIA